MAFFPVEHWDSGVEEWDKIVDNRNFPHYFYYYEADLYIHDIVKNAKLALELGAGTCGSTLKHASRDIRIVALDYSRLMLKAGRVRLKRAGIYDQTDLVVADECHLPFKSECFDAVYSRGVALSYASEPELFVKEALRVLQRGRPIGIDFMNRIVADKSTRRFHRFESVNGVRYYVEQFNEGQKQRRVGYRLPDSFRFPEDVSKGPVFGGFESRPDWLNLEGLEKQEYWAIFYAPLEAKKLFRSSGFSKIELFPLGCLSYAVKSRELHEFLRDNRENMCRLQKELARVFKLETGVHIFLNAVKI